MVWGRRLWGLVLENLFPLERLGRDVRQGVRLLPGLGGCFYVLLGPVFFLPPWGFRELLLGC